jgi:hypothetical protein
MFEVKVMEVKDPVISISGEQPPNPPLLTLTVDFNPVKAIAGLLLSKRTHKKKAEQAKLDV